MRHWGLLALVVSSACTGDQLEWIALEDASVTVSEPIELAVASSEASVIDFYIDGALVGTCDPAQPDEDCKIGDVFRWTVVFTEMGEHVVTASYTGPDGFVSSERRLTVTAPEMIDGEMPIVEAVVDDDVDETEEEIAVRAASRGSLDPARGFHRIFGGQSWKVASQRVVLATHTPRGSVDAVRACLHRYGPSIRHWADFYHLSRASIVATAITESNCTNPAGSSDGLSSGPMQVTASTCSAITGLSRTTCRIRMHTRPGFSFRVGAKYMASSFQRGQHHRDPPKIAAAYNAGSLRKTFSNPWHMVSTGNHIDRFVRAYNAYRAWEHEAGLVRLDADDNAEGLVDLSEATE